MEICKDEYFTDNIDDFYEDLTPNRNREHTKSSIFLIHKWVCEGMPIKTVARILNRSEDNVGLALRYPLDENQLFLLRRYFSRFRER